MTSDDRILTEVKENVGVLTINRPEVLNALDTPTLLALEKALIAAEENADIRVIVVTGAGERAFVAGADIADINNHRGLSFYLEFTEINHRVFRRFRNPATNRRSRLSPAGPWAGGCELVLSLDIRLLADTARLGLPEITLGMFPRRRRHPTGDPPESRPCRAREMMFTGERLTAEEAVALGLANRVVPKAELMDEALALAGQIAEKSSLALKPPETHAAQGRRDAAGGGTCP